MNTRASAFDSDFAAEHPEDVVATSQRPGVDGVLKSLQNVATLSEALRILGASVILASMSVFLLQGWSEGNDISRYLLLLTQTGLLAAAGFAMSYLLQEMKGARLFFGLALVSIPANFTILGALLYSVVQWDGGLITYPGFADWRIGDVANIGVTASAAMFVLIPVTWFCFAVMARHSAKVLSLHFVALNALLLLPVRESAAAGTIALAGAVYALIAISRLTRDNVGLKTGEGRFALAALFIPLGIVLFRSMYFYRVDSLMLAMVGLVLFLVARQTSRFPGRSDRLALVLEVASWPLALLIALAVTDALQFSVGSGLDAALFAGVYTILALDIMRRTGSRVLTKVVGASVSVAVALSFTIGVMLSGSAASALMSVVVGVGLLVWGIAGKRVISLVAGLIALAAGVSFGFDAIVALVVQSSWIDLAIFGGSAIVLGSVLDRHGVALKLRLARWYRGAKESHQTALEK